MQPTFFIYECVDICDIRVADVSFATFAKYAAV